ncbi:MAG: SoxR reducing system RseC family protein [Nitrospinae bacterium]|nr:SoxR reducing system RseC family protein [Nitrospinota bacterium]
MREEGIVIETYGEFAKVEAKRSLSCEGCVSKDMCKPGGGSSMIVEALNPVGARAGDRVAFEISRGVLLKSSFILYLMPVIFILTGAWIGGEAASIYFQSSNKEAISAVSAALFFILSIMVVVFLNRYFLKNVKYKPVIKEILYAPSPSPK